ncbi:MAG TPA: molybdopterin-dependent oxidoreductase [Pseudaminobacter sp.]|nr:molybdopterin-dependent oxidoreductase [Pseudaminobacter sp.]
MEMVREAGEVKTACPYCGVGCGVLAKIGADGSVSVRGDPEHPANFGRLCSKGSALAETIGAEGRLLHPEIHGRRVDWDEALELVASKFSETIAEHGPDSVALYVSGQLLTEDYYVANKLMKGFVGSANIDTNSRLCMASSVAGHRRAFGSDTVPGTYEDLELADLIVLVGSNLAWCHPVLYQRIAAAKAARPAMKVVLVDPRRTMTADIADLHLPVRADGDIALFNGLLAHLVQAGVIDRTYVEVHTTGLDEAIAAAGAPELAAIAEAAGIDGAALAEFLALFAATERTVTVYSQGVNQSSVGTDKVNAIINCHLATGRIGRPGMGPFSVTGQPNAMGGREVGGLANMLAAHMDIENPVHRDRVHRFWQAPNVAIRPGLKAVDMFRAVADGRIKALWIMATNPVDSLPEGDAVEAAIAACPFVVISEVEGETDTSRHAHVKLPAAAWGEKDGTVTNSERRISRQRPFLRAPGEARPDWWIIGDVAKRMGFGAAFAYDSPAEIFAEHAALSAFENDGERDFDIGAHDHLDWQAYQDMEPFQWPAPAGGDVGDTRFFSEGGYFTPDRKARFVAIRSAAPDRTGAAFPLVLNTGRVRDHWHTMTRTARSQRLSQHLAEPFVELHPVDAARNGIRDADVVRVASSAGSILVRALLSSRQREGAVFVPMHWTDQFASGARVDRLVPALTDPLSGQPASKHVPVAIEQFQAAAYGFAVLASRPETIDADYWAVARCAEGWRVELAFADAGRDWTLFADGLFGASSSAESLSYHDLSGGQRRYACFEGDKLVGALFLDREPVAAPRNWAVEQLAAKHEGRRPRLSVMAARPGQGVADRGATVCSCFGIGANQIAAAAANGCATVEAIGKVLQAGTNCGSCRAEIRGIVDAHRLQAAE